MRKIAFFTILFLLICAFSVSAGAYEYTNPQTGYRAVMEDDHDLLTEEEEFRLMTVMMPLTEQTNIAFCSACLAWNQSEARENTERKHIQLFGSGVNGLVFMIDMRARYMFLDTEGRAQVVIPKSTAEIITNDVRSDMTAGRYYEASASVFTQIQAKFDGGRIAEPMRYLSAIAIGIMGGLLTALIVTVRKRKEVVPIYSKEAVWATVALTAAAKELKFVPVISHERKYSPRSSDSGCSSCSSGSSCGGGGSCGGGSSF